MSGFHPRDLIKEIKMRPGIYNKYLLEHPRREHKHQLWLEVAERLTPAEDWESYKDVEKEARIDEIMAKWKHLRDHFHREIKLQEAGEAHKKRKYVYFDDMEFMRPFVGFKMTPNRSSVKSTDSMYESNTQDVADNDTDIDMDAFLKTTDNIEDEEEEDTKANVSDTLPELGRTRSKRIIKPTPKALQNKPTSSSTPTPARSSQKEAVIKNFDVLKKTSGGSAGTNAGNNPTFKIRDGDISFCLSLVPTLRKLGDGRKLRAKIEILKVLHKYVDHIERTKLMNRSNVSNHNNNGNNSNQIVEHDDDMAEDHLEEYEEGGPSGISVKNEDHSDPLNGSTAGSGVGSGNTKIWWT